MRLFFREAFRPAEVMARQKRKKIALILIVPTISNLVRGYRVSPFSDCFERPA
jgi:fatty acid-binding protein DegV